MIFEQLNIKNYVLLNKYKYIYNNNGLHIYAIPQNTLLPNHIIIISEKEISQNKYYKLKHIEEIPALPSILLKHIINLTLGERIKQVNMFKFLQEINKQIKIIFTIDKETEEMKKAILSLPKKDFNKLKNLIITSGYKIDTNLYKFIKPYFIRFPEFKNNLTTYQKFMPNAIICSSSKTGKSHIFSKLAIIFDRISIAHLLGSYTEKIGMFQGSVNENTTPIAIDEIQEEKRTGIINQSLGILEMGKSRVGLVTGVEAKMCCPLIVLRNPSTLGNSEEEKMLNSLIDTLEKLGNTPEALGTRFIPFFMKTKKSEETPNIINKEEELIILHNIILDILGTEKLKKIFDDNFDWLIKEFDNGFIENINKMIEEYANEQVRTFIISLPNGYRHFRGWALLKSVYDKLFEILHDDNYKIPQEVLDKNFEMLKDITLTSIKNMFEVSSQTSKDFFLYQANKTLRKTPKIIIYLILLYYKETKKLEFPIDDLRQKFNSLDNDFKKILFKFYKFKNKIKHHSELLTSIGIQLDNNIIKINEKFYNWLENENITLTKTFEIKLSSSEIKEKIEQLKNIKGNYFHISETNLTEDEIKQASHNGLLIMKSNGIIEILI